MKQPELGKKISELRQARGFTQDELAELCKLNVRTIQRIESSDVNPRSYTIRQILEALGYDYHRVMNERSLRLDHASEQIGKWLGQCRYFVSDLFNLKTNTMKKLMILSTPVLLAFMVLFFSSLHTKAQQSEKMQKVFEEAASNAKFINWFNNGNIDSLCAMYSDHAFLTPAESSSINGKESIRQYYHELFNSGMRFTHARSYFKVVSDTIAVDRGTWTMAFGDEFILSGTYMNQWHYDKGHWLIQNEITKMDAMPGAP